MFLGALRIIGPTTKLQMKHYRCFHLFFFNFEAKRLQIIDDNYGLENKNAYVLWFCLCLILTGSFGKVWLAFMISEHTKNVFDGVFWHFQKEIQEKQCKNTKIHDAAF